jgi:hypothetical protein
LSRCSPHHVRGEDLDKETRTTLSKECKGCAEIFQEPVKTGGKRAAGKGKQPMTKSMQTQVVKQREPRPRSHKVRYFILTAEELTLSMWMEGGQRGPTCFQPSAKMSSRRYCVTRRSWQRMCWAQGATMPTSHLLRFPHATALHGGRDVDYSQDAYTDISTSPFGSVVRAGRRWWCRCRRLAFLSRLSTSLLSCHMCYSTL